MMDNPESLKLPNSQLCFVCGAGNPAGLRVRFHTDGEKVWTRVAVDESHMGYRGIVHGGVLTALLDETMGWAPAVAMGRFCMAIELNIEFRRSLPVGKEVTVLGWMTEGARRIWEAAGEIRDDEGTVYAKGKGRFMPMSDEQTREVVPYLNFDEGTIPVSRICRSCGEMDGV